MSELVQTIITKNKRTEEATLIGLKGPVRGRNFLLVGRKVLLGRGDSCDIILDDLNASRKHVLITMGREGHLLVDQKSKNGVYINHERKARHKLENGDIVEIGSSLFRFEVAPSKLGSRHFTLGKEVIPNTTKSAARKSIGLETRPYTRKAMESALTIADQVDLYIARTRVLIENNRRAALAVAITLITLSTFWLFGGLAEQRKTDDASQAQPTPSSPAKVQPATHQTSSFNTTALPPGKRSNPTYEDRNAARQHYSQATQAFYAGDYRRAISLYGSALEKDPDHPAAAKKRQQAEEKLHDMIHEYYNRGVREFTNLYYDRAVRAWERSMALSFEFAPDFYEKSKLKIAEARSLIAETR